MDEALKTEHIWRRGIFSKLLKSITEKIFIPYDQKRRELLLGSIGLGTSLLIPTNDFGISPKKVETSTDEETLNLFFESLSSPEWSRYQSEEIIANYLHLLFGFEINMNEFLDISDQYTNKVPLYDDENQFRWIQGLDYTRNEKTGKGRFSQLTSLQKAEELLVVDKALRRGSILYFKANSSRNGSHRFTFAAIYEGRNTFCLFANGIQRTLTFSEVISTLYPTTSDLPMIVNEAVCIVNPYEMKKAIEEDPAYTPCEVSSDHEKVPTQLLEFGVWQYGSVGDPNQIHGGLGWDTEGNSIGNDPTAVAQNLFEKHELLRQMNPSLQATKPTADIILNSERLAENNAALYYEGSADLIRSIQRVSETTKKDASISFHYVLPIGADFSTIKSHLTQILTGNSPYLPLELLLSTQFSLTLDLEWNQIVDSNPTFRITADQLNELNRIYLLHMRRLTGLRMRKDISASLPGHTLAGLPLLSIYEMGAGTYLRTEEYPQLDRNIQIIVGSMGTIDAKSISYDIIQDKFGERPQGIMFFSRNPAIAGQLGRGESDNITPEEEPTAIQSMLDDKNISAIVFQ